MEILPFLVWPFVASLILTGIHAYLGVHVVERGVIFVDLALAQIAALGATIAILVGMDPHGQGAYWLSLAFTFIGAAIFAFARTARGHIPQEAFIGIAYAVASAAAILAMSKATGETEHLKDMLRSEEHTSELQSQSNLVCRLLLEKKKRPKVYMILDR